jgi:hypothetical protein
MTSIERSGSPRFVRLVSTRGSLSPSADEVLWARHHAHLLGMVLSLKCFQSRLRLVTRFLPWGLSLPGAQIRRRLAFTISSSRCTHRDTHRMLW